MSGQGYAGAIGVVGVGYVGLVTAVCFADLGYDVVCRDIDPARVEKLRGGGVPIYEPRVAQLLERNRDRLRFTLDMADVFERCRVVFVCVDTPSLVSGDADLSRVQHVLSELPQLDERVLLVMKSTVPVGTGEKVRAELAARGLDNVGYASNPEFLREGRAVSDFLEPDRIVVGAFDEGDADLVCGLYGDIDAPIVRTDVPSAEMIKYAANCFLATKISFINEIANVCEEVGADVSVVAHGMGLDQRIGTHFLRAGVGYGGSCLAGDETVLARIEGHERLLALEELVAAYADGADGEVHVDRPQGLEVLAWRHGAECPEYLPVSALTRREVEGEALEVVTKMGRRVTCTPDHPFVVLAGPGAGVKLACDLGPGDWLPVLQAPPARDAEPIAALPVLAGMEAAGLGERDVILRIPLERARELRRGPKRPRALSVLEHHRSPAARLIDIERTGALRLHEARRLGLEVDGASAGTARNGTYVPLELPLDEGFWRMVGLYIAEGCISRDGDRCRILWHFHPRDEEHLVEEVVAYWARHGVRTAVRRKPTSTVVEISSRLLAGFLTGVVGLGRTCYEQRLPDLVWSQPAQSQLAMLSGIWQGDGSWSRIAGGPSVVLEHGTVSRELADGMLRLLGGLGVMARLKVGRGRKSTRDTYWLSISGADQVERLLVFVRSDERHAALASLRTQRRRIAPTGYRRRADGVAAVRVARVERRPWRGPVYSLEVPGAGTVATSGGLVVHNCFPKDVRALKQLAGNSGYHFQLLTAVIEVNELQKRRVVGKLKAHLGSLRGRRIALLGLAFKADTDDMREATSLVLSSRLLAEGAEVVAYDPVAMAQARRLLADGVELAASMLEAVTGADAAVVVTEWGEFRKLASAEVREAMATPLIVDGRNLLDPQQAREAGFTYESIGRPAHEHAPLTGAALEP